MGNALKRHWPEYLMEAAGLGLFMVSVEASFFPSSAAVNPGLTIMAPARGRSPARAAELKRSSCL